MIRRPARDRGAIIPLTALLLSVIILSVAFAVDLGKQRAERRDMQAIADVVSLDLARAIQGRDAATVDADPAWTAAVLSASARNDHPTPTIPCPDGDIADRCVTVTLGNVPDPTTQEFLPCPPVGDPARAACLPDAVEVVAGTDVDYSFQPGSGDTRRSAVAQVGDLAQARFQVGSSLASINPQSNSVIGGILNDVAPGASLLGYEGLANADLSLDELGIALGIPITAASPDELLATQVTYEELAVATATALQNSGGDAADVAVLNDFNSLEVSQTQVSLGEALGVAAGGGPIGGGATVNAAQFLTTTAFLADGTHAVTIPAATVAIPGVGDVVLSMTGIEGPQQGGNNDGASATTRQIDLELSTGFDVNSATSTQQLCNYPSTERNNINALLGGILSFLGCALNPLSQALPVSVRVVGNAALELELAQVTATQSIDCASTQVTLTPTPSVVTAAGTSDFTAQARLGSAVLPVAALNVPITATSTGSAAPPPPFVADAPGTPLPTGTYYDSFTPGSATVGSNPLGLGNLLDVDNATLSLLGANLNIVTVAARNLARDVLNQTLASLDVALVQPLTELLGVNLGGSYLEPLWLRCDSSAVKLVG